MPQTNQPQGPVDIKAIMADYDKAVKFFANTPAEVWEALGQKTALSVFKETAEKISPYQKVLKKKNIIPSKIQDFDSFSSVPMIDKNTYINRFGFNEINPVQAGKNLYSLSLSSGTADKPTIWPRYYQYEEFLPLVFNIFMRQYWQIDKKSTLLINAFAMGSWIAGFTVHSAVRPLTQRYNLTLATPGADLTSIIQTVKQIGRFYDQIVIFSYPTFVRLVLDGLIKSGIDLKKIRLKLFIAGEGHTVEWRHYINKLISGDPENLTDIIDGYGITDTGLSGLGSSLTNLIRDLALKDHKLCKALFGEGDIVPSLFQYNPGTYFIEEVKGEIVITTKSTTPLVRYNIHDRGGVIEFRKMVGILKAYGYEYEDILKNKGLPAEIVWKQPFVFCFGRRTDTVIVGGANIFPEQIMPAIICEKTKNINSFKLSLESNNNQRQRLVVSLELKTGLAYNSSTVREVKKNLYNKVLQQLIKVNGDYADAYKIDPKATKPMIRLFAYGTGPFLEDKKRTKPKLLIRSH